MIYLNNMASKSILLCLKILVLLLLFGCQSERDIFQAIDMGFIHEVEKILDKEKYLVNSRKDGFTPISIAIKKQNIDIARLLLKYGADVDSKVGRHSSTPLMIASAEGCKNCVDFLLNAGARIDEKDDISMTPLLYAVINENVAIVEFLIKNGADINHKDKYAQENALQKAALHGYYSITKVLIANGAMADFYKLLRQVRVKLYGIPYADESVKDNYKKIITLLESYSKK